MKGATALLLLLQHYQTEWIYTMNDSALLRLRLLLQQLTSGRPLCISHFVFVLFGPRC